MFHPACIHSYFRGTSRCPTCPVNATPSLDFGDNELVAEALRGAVFVNSPSAPSTQSRSKFWPFSKKTDYPVGATADELVTFKAPIHVFVERGLKASDIAESGVKLDEWINTGYTLEDLHTLEVTWDDFVHMGFGPQLLKTVRPSFLVDALKADISKLLQIGTTLNHLIDSRYSCNDLLALKCSTHTLINMGLRPENKKLFPFTNEEWNRLALKKQ